jgi:hypothetical protein
MMKRLTGVAALLAVVGYISYAYAAGQFAGLPIVGSATYCQGTSTGATGTQVCTVNVPAGPTTIPATTLIPGDTELAQGAQPQTVYIPLAALNALPLTVAVVVSQTTTTLTATNLTGGYILSSTGTMTKVTIALPPAPADKQQFAVGSSNTVTAFAFTSVSPITVSNSPTVLTVSTTASFGYRLMFDAASTTWFRLQ